MNRQDYVEKLSGENKYCVFCGVALPNQAPIVKLFRCDVSERGITTGVDFNGRNYHPIEVKLTDHCEDLSDNRPYFIKESVTEILIEYVTCPQCKETSITVHRPIDEGIYHVYPRSTCKKFPEYVPLQIRQDYEEACLITDLSPKASATLSRRCIQGMIRDFFGIVKDRLADEIDEVAKKAGISPSQASALKALKDIGNIGAHPERDIKLIVDVEPDEAKLLISLIEFFMEHWYINKHNEEEKLNEIVNISKQKKDLRHSSCIVNQRK